MRELGTGRRQAAAGDTGWSWPVWAALGVAFAAGVGLRWYLLTTDLAYVDVDEATIGLQARDFLTSPDVFFPAQPYGGSLEVPFVAVLSEIGARGPLWLKLVPMAFHLATCVVAWRVATRFVPSRLGQLAVPVVLWCGPAYGVWESTKERGFYGAALLVAATVLLLGLRVLERPAPRRALAFGVGLGVAVWTSPLLAAATVPVVAWLAVRRPDLWRHIPWTLLGALAGGSPWLVWNLRHDWASLDQQAAFGSTVGSRFRDGIERLPQLVGLVTPFAPDRALFPGAAATTYVLLIVAVVVAAARTRRGAPALLPVLVVGYLLVYPLGSVTAFVGADLRYLYPLLPALALVAAATLPGARRAAVAIVAVVVATSALSLWGIRGMASDSATGDLFLAAPGLDDVIDRLEEDGVRYVLSDVAGYQITYATDWAIEGTVFNRPRFPELERIALIDTPSTYVLLGGESNRRFEEQMARDGIGYTREEHGVWVLYRLDAYYPPWEADFRLFFDVPVTPPD